MAGKRPADRRSSMQPRQNTSRAQTQGNKSTSPATKRFISLLGQQNQLRVYLDMVHVLVLALDDNGCIQFINRPAARLLGWKRDDLLGRDWFETCLLPQDRPEIRRIFDEVMAGKLALHERHENKILCRTGKTKLIDWHNTLLMDDGGRPIGTLSSGRDITEERRLQQELESAAREWNATFEAMPDAICIMDTQQHMHRCNKAMHEWFPELSRPGRRPPVCYHVVHRSSEPVPECPFVRMRRSLQRESSELLVDGRWYEVTVDPVFDSTGALDGAVHFMRDITERKKAEEERSQLASQFLQAQKMEAVGRMAGGIAHDFNNMLTVILGYVEAALARPSLPPDVREDLSEVRSAAKRSADLTRRLLAFSKHQIVRPKTLDLRSVVEDLGDMLGRILGETIHLSIRADRDLWPVRVDPTQMDQVIMNLVINAKDAMPQGGHIVLELRNVVFDDDYVSRKLDCNAGDHVMLAVSDTGLGMDTETLSHALEPFFTTKGPSKGTGLGLSTVYGIANRCGGTVHIYSQPDMGTTVKVYFPRASATGEARKPSRSRTMQRLGGDETILLVEDDDQLRALARTMLEKLGYRVITASNGPEALAMAARVAEPIHLLLTDLVMPKMSGPQLVERFGQDHPDTKILYMSGYTATMVARYGYLDERFPFLPKPFSLALLANKVRLALDSPTNPPKDSNH